MTRKTAGRLYIALVIAMWVAWAAALANLDCGNACGQGGGGGWWLER